jgi:hypothetical protein
VAATVFFPLHVDAALANLLTLTDLALLRLLFHRHVLRMR